MSLVKTRLTKTSARNKSQFLALGLVAAGAVFHGCQLNQSSSKSNTETPPQGEEGGEEGLSLAQQQELSQQRARDQHQVALAALSSNTLKLRAAHADKTANDKTNAKNMDRNPQREPARDQQRDSDDNQDKAPQSALENTSTIEIGSVAVANCDASMDTSLPKAAQTTAPTNTQANTNIQASASANTLTGVTREFKGLLRTELRLNSVFGNSTVRLTTVAAGKGDQIEAIVDGQSLRFGVDLQAVINLHSEACKTLKADSPSDYIASDKQIDTMREWLQRVAPDCEHLRVEANGWTCTLPGSDPDSALQELEGISTTMIRRWNRQPYLLARRLAVGRSLARALANRAQAEKHLDTVCNVMKNSLPMELPATMSSQRWQRAVCSDVGKLDGKQRLAAALFGLNKTVGEIDFLRQLFERTSRLGSLAVKLPKDAPNQVWISLTPGPDVAENLTRETTKLWSTDIGGDSDELPRACWHPVYGEDATLMHLARNLTLAGDAGNVECVESLDINNPRNQRIQKQQASLERYFAESITSETEFILANGRTKTLRLPSGTYNYILRTLPENPNEWDEAVTGGYIRAGASAEASAEASAKGAAGAAATNAKHEARQEVRGQIVWDNHKPRPIISAW